MIQFTAFSSIFDNKTHRVKTFDSWEDFGKCLYAMSKVKGYKPKKGERKKGSPLISPAIYNANTTRSNENVTHWSRWAALDIDDIDCTLEEALEVFAPYSYYCYSSASSREDNPKFRVVLQLTDIVERDKIKHFWFALNKEFNSMIDPQTKDLSRMYYVPADYPNAYNFCKAHRGKSIDPEEFMLKHDYIEEKKDLMSHLPPEMQRAMIQKRKDSLNNLDVVWTSYMDCPFVSRKLVKEYETIAYTDGTGRYTFMYKFMLNTAGAAIRRKYPITPGELASLARDLDRDNGNRYKSRPLELEAERALEFVIRTAPWDH